MISHCCQPGSSSRPDRRSLTSKNTAGPSPVKSHRVDCGVHLISSQRVEAPVGTWSEHVWLGALPARCQAGCNQPPKHHRHTSSTPLLGPYLPRHCRRSDGKIACMFCHCLPLFCVFHIWMWLELYFVSLSASLFICMSPCRQVAVELFLYYEITIFSWTCQVFEWLFYYYSFLFFFKVQYLLFQKEVRHMFCHLGTSTLSLCLFCFANCAAASLL